MSQSAPKSLNWGKAIYPCLAWSSVVAILGVIFWGALSATVPIPTYFPGQDKVEHLLGFILFGGLLAAAASHRHFLWTLFFCFALSIGVEYAQRFLTTTREFSMDDASASALGSFIGVSVCSLIQWTWALFAEKRLKLSVQRI